MLVPVAGYGGGVDPSRADALAARAGLVRLPADTPGFHRRRRGKGFTFTDPSGAPVSAQERARLQSLVIPPAWRDVWIAPRDDSHILATGIDDAGRKQYLYHPAWRSAADAEKFERLAGFGEALPRLRRQVVDDIRRGDELTSQLALLVRLVDLSLIRGGSRCYTEQHGTFGATTLLASHVEVVGSTVHLAFPGKGGTEHDLSVSDRLVATRLRQLVADVDDDSHLFTDDAGRPIERDDLNEYLYRTVGDYTVKYFRTWGATCLVTQHLATAGLEGTAAVKAAIEHAADALGNTPTVCRSSYVAPVVVEAHDAGALVDAWRTARSSRWMSRAERATARLLRTAAADLTAAAA